jgi:hypothetical protein
MTEWVKPRVPTAWLSTSSISTDMPVGEDDEEAATEGGDGVENERGGRPGARARDEAG